MSVLEQFVNSVRNYSSQGTFDQLYDYCSKTSDALVKNSAHLDDALATLDVQEHSLGVLTILCVKMSVAGNAQDTDALYGQIAEFVNNCNGEQVRFAPDMFAELCHLYTNSLVRAGQPLKGIALIARAIAKIQLHPAQLTSIHADLCQLCLLAKNVKPAIQVLDTDITDISREGGHYDVKYFLSYYYYGGLIYASVKNYDRALYFFESALTTHSLAVSHIMLESYKKYVLISLIVYGKVPNLPKYTPQIVSRFIKPYSQPYLDLVAAYSTNSPEDLANVISKHAETYTRDKNFGFVKQVQVSLYKKSIQRLTKTFLTLSLADVASRVQLSGAAEAEQYIIKMIAAGEIFASINQKDGMVVFLDNHEKYNTAKMFRKVEDEIKACISAEEKLRAMDQDISINPKYVQKTRTENE